MNKKQPNKQKCQPKVYTESDFRSALRKALMSVETNHMKLAIGSFALILHRELNLSPEQIDNIIRKTNEYSIKALCFQDIRKEMLQETNLDIEDYINDLL